MISFILLYVHLQVINCMHAHDSNSIVMSLAMKIINRRKFKKTSKVLEKYITDSIRRNRIFSRLF